MRGYFSPFDPRALMCALKARINAALICPSIANAIRFMTWTHKCETKQQPKQPKALLISKSRFNAYSVCMLGNDKKNKLDHIHGF